MKLINRTPYDTNALRWLVTRCHAHLAKSEGRLAQWAEVQVTINPAHQQHGLSGRSWSTRHCTISLPTRSKADTRKAADVVQHELCHLYGYADNGYRVTNAQVTGQGFRIIPTTDVTGKDWQWAVDHLGPTLARRAPRPRPKVDYPAVRYARIIELIARWEAKARRVQTALRKLRRRRRDYDRRPAALPVFRLPPADSGSGG
jgi:hypothetical protein